MKVLEKQDRECQDLLLLKLKNCIVASELRTPYLKLKPKEAVMSVTYRDLPKDIDPIAFLFDDDKLTVPESYFTPDMTARFYERALQMVDMQALHNKSAENPQGLESLPSLLRYEPGHYGTKWLKLEASKEAIEPALPSKTPYQLQYLTLFSARLPKWKELELIEKETTWGGKMKVIGDISTVMLLFGKNRQLYIVTARWKPVEEYFGGGEEPRFLEEGPYVFNLDHLAVEPVEWSDSRVIEKIADGQWSDTHAFRAGLQLALSGTAYILEARVNHMRCVADRLERMAIYYGR